MASPSKTAIFNLALAVLIGVAAGFAAFALPDWRLERLVGMTGLPSLLTAAQPPLGTTARLSIVAITAISLSLLVWFVLRAFDAPSAKASPRHEQAVDDSDDWLAELLPSRDEPPAMPVTRPLRAAELDDVFAQPATAPAVRFEMPVAPTPAGTLHLEVDQIEQDNAPVSATEEEAFVEWDSPLHLEADEADEGMTTAELLARLPLPEQESASVASLVQRLNAGLANSEWPLPEGDEAKPEMDARLRSVLSDLQKIAGGNG